MGGSEPLTSPTPPPCSHLSHLCTPFLFQNVAEFFLFLLSSVISIILLKGLDMKTMLRGKSSCYKLILVWHILYLPTLTHYAWDAWGLETSISRIKDNFSRLTHKSGRVVLKKLCFISDLLCIISLLFIKQ